MRNTSGSGALSIALVGTRGVPARYGGFETCVEEVGTRLAADGHRVVVYCRHAPGQSTEDLPDTYRGMELVHFPAAQRRSLETLSHTALSVRHLASHKTDSAIVFNSANAPFLPVLRAAKVPFATHVDGLEWQRGKWGTVGKHYYRVSERLAVRWSDALIADAQGISDYYRDKFGAATELISYGAPQIDSASDRLGELGLAERGYHLVVARFEPENNIDMVVKGYVDSGATLPLIVVGSAPYADEYTNMVHELADERVQFLGGVWDQELLDQLYANCMTYVHGHSVGGTNPSLLRALGAGAATNAFDVVFNREVLGDAGRYFATAAQASELFEASEKYVATTSRRGMAARERAKLYDWDLVADQYLDLCQRLASSARR
jgi:glycosyltransferase involved in cell wall biosynthesis